MTGAGDADGEISRDEATWRDLVARFDRPADTTLTEVPWPAREDLPGSAATGSEASRTATDAPTQDIPAESSPTADPVSMTPDQPPAPRPEVRPWPEPDGGYRPADRTRVVRPAGDPRSYTPPDEDDDERYVPAPLPPPAKLDSISKAAVVAVIAGPGYLLIASVFMHWTISALALFIAVAAFIGGFVTLVVKLGDRSRRDDDDDGAVL
jgi:hypothetical protein